MILATDQELKILLNRIKFLEEELENDLQDSSLESYDDDEYEIN